MSTPGRENAVEKPRPLRAYATPRRRGWWASWWEAASLGCVGLELLAAAVVLDAGMTRFYGQRSFAVLLLALVACGLTAAVGIVLAAIALARPATRSKAAWLALLLNFLVPAGLVILFLR